jgi:UDP-glucuronate 4-epimerase
MQKIMVTGSAGFIGSTLSLKLLELGYRVIGIDNHNNYYNPQLKEDRLARHLHHEHYSHHRLSLEDRDAINDLFNTENPDYVVNLAAQAGVRYSIENPLAYIDSNLVGFAHILEGCRNTGVKHLIYASSSSVYGGNTKMPFSPTDPVNHPVSLYAATKKANELMAHTYSHLFQIPTTGLRFFTVYGPWDRPDMALQKFAQAMVHGKPIQLFNYGNHRRDFTYIDDIVEGIVRVIEKPASSDANWRSDEPNPASSIAPWRVYNIGSNNPVELVTYVELLEKALGVQVEKELLPLQPGDVPDTYADVDDLIHDFDYQPTTTVEDGVAAFARWFKSYYK